MSDGGYQAWLITQNLKENYLCEPHQSVTPKRPLPHLAYLSDKECEPSDAALKTAERIKSVSIPPLIKAYMRLGAKVCGDPCWDPEFKCADLFILLDVDNLSPRYKKHFLKTA
ncbi:MAG: hypothetical protein MI864_10830 [Pseudomonadales bacterium]|nr:hypothetical protein [Pseudomonadales bacterium]